jgi:antitoxin HigA-1
MRKKLTPVHPGEVLREDFLDPMNLSARVVARACGVPRTRIERLVREETPVTADTALRLAKYFGTTAAFWMGMQTQYDLERTGMRYRPRSNAFSPSKRVATPLRS